MDKKFQSYKLNFLYTHSSYRGQCKVENLVFNANLQEFAQKVSYVSALETGGKISAEQAYEDVKRLGKQLNRSKNQLGISSIALED